MNDIRRYIDLLNEAIDNETAHWKTLRDTGFYGSSGAGCILMAKDTGRMLFAHRSGAVEQPGTWGIWGGAMDSGEDPVEAVKRELHEECGYFGKIEEIVPLYVFRKGTFTYHNFLTIIPSEFTPKLNWESQGYEWCEYGDWPHPLHFGVEALLSDSKSLSAIEDRLSKD